MILTAHQPTYLPWLGLFHKIALADKFCFFDDVQYQPKDWNNRNKIKFSNGKENWLSVPVKRTNYLDLFDPDGSIDITTHIDLGINGGSNKYFDIPFVHIHFNESKDIVIDKSFMRM